MPTSRFPRGAVLKCRFPYDNDPHRPGPLPHYCLFVEAIDVAGMSLATVCYGTSRLDDDLLRLHQGLIFDVPSSYVRGVMPGPVSHFVADHVAVIPVNDDWIASGFEARLDFVRPEKRENDMVRRRLYAQFELFNSHMNAAGILAIDSFIQTGLVGLPHGKTLR